MDLIKKTGKKSTKKNITLLGFTLISIMNNNIKVGNLVEHKIFGKGKVLYIDGQGENSKLTIKFYNNVTKKLILKYAKLKLLKDTYEK